MDNNACTFVSLDEVVNTVLSKKQDFHYGAALARIVHSSIENKDGCYFNAAAIEKRLNELKVTEDAEVVSITTVPRNH